MLYITPCEDIKIGEELSEKIFGVGDITDGAILLFNDKTPIGLAEIYVGSDFVGISRIGVLPDFRGRGAGDFFARVIIFKLMSYELPIKLDFVNDYYQKLGFKKQDKTMLAECEDIKFPSCCGGNH